MSDMIFDKLSEIITEGQVLVGEPMSSHTTFRVGGKADYYVIPGNKMEATETVRLLLAEGIPYYVLGNGSNVLVSDEGYRGVVVCISKGMDDVDVDGDMIIAGAGALLSKVAMVALANNLTGLEFASGIPGSLGGAIVMNAGAYGGEMKDIVESVELFDTVSGEVERLSNEDMMFAYRNSIVKQHPYIVLSVSMRLSKGNSEDIKQAMNDLAVQRRQKQPLEYPSAGSTFKRPEGYFAAKLIDDAGLRGYMVGGAQVSDKHCGFVINKDNAKASDVIALMRHVREVVDSKFGVVLEPEVCMLGEDMRI